MASNMQTTGPPQVSTLLYFVTWLFSVRRIIVTVWCASMVIPLTVIQAAPQASYDGFYRSTTKYGTTNAYAGELEHLFYLPLSALGNHMLGF